MKPLTDTALHNLFYVPPDRIYETEVVLEEEVHHIAHVLRKRLHEEILATDGKGSCYRVQLIEITKSRIRAHIVDKTTIKRTNAPECSLAFVPLKGLRNDFILEKGTELGVRAFLPFISKFSTLPVLQRAKMNRFKKIAIQAMLQSQQFHLPGIVFRNDCTSLVKTFDDFDCVLLADPRGRRDIPCGAGSFLYIVGPEGGFDDDEKALFEKHGAQRLWLGPHRLRSETAALVGLTKILVACGRT